MNFIFFYFLNFIIDFYTDSSTTNDFTETVINNPATLKWSATDSNGVAKSIAVPINNDDICESTETFEVHLTNVFGGTLGTQTSATVSIIDDDCKFLGILRHHLIQSYLVQRQI